MAPWRQQEEWSSAHRYVPVPPDQGAGIRPVGVVKGKLVCWLVRMWPRYKSLLWKLLYAGRCTPSGTGLGYEDAAASRYMYSCACASRHARQVLLPAADGTLESLFIDANT